MKTMRKKNLRTGMFGVITTGEKFVVVNDLLVYEGGGFDWISSMDDDLSFSCYSIDKLYQCDSFRQLDSAINNPILKSKYECLFDRERCVTEMSISEIEERLGIKNLKIIKED